MYIAAFEIFEGGDAGAQSGGKLVAAIGIDHGQAGENIGGDGDQSAPSGHRIHKSGQKHQWADDEQCVQTEIHNQNPLFFK